MEPVFIELAKWVEPFELLFNDRSPAKLVVDRNECKLRGLAVTGNSGLELVLEFSTGLQVILIISPFNRPPVVLEVVGREMGGGSGGELDRGPVLPLVKLPL